MTIMATRLKAKPAKDTKAEQIWERLDWPEAFEEEATVKNNVETMKNHVQFLMMLVDTKIWRASIPMMTLRIFRQSATRTAQTAPTVFRFRGIKKSFLENNNINVFLEDFGKIVTFNYYGKLEWQEANFKASEGQQWLKNESGWIQGICCGQEQCWSDE